MNAIAGRNDGKIVAVACWDGLVLAFLAGVKRRGCWVLGAGCWVLGAGCWGLGAGGWVLRAARAAQATPLNAAAAVAL